MALSRRFAPWAVTPLALPGTRIEREQEMKGVSSFIAFAERMEPYSKCLTMI
jgi:hypothetical protein